MKDLLLTPEPEYDLDVSLADAHLIDGAEQVRQQLEIKLKLWTGEWFLNTAFGTPYLQKILGKQLSLSGVIAALRISILEVEGVRSITEFDYTFDNTTRKFDVYFVADTAYGLIPYNGTL